MSASAPVVVVAAVTAGLFLVTAARSFQYRDHPGGLPFAITTGILAGVAVVIGIGRASDEPGLWVTRAVLLGWELATVAWAAFAFDYTGRGPAMTPRRIGGLLLFGVLALLAVEATAVLRGVAQPVAVFTATALQLLTVAVGAFGAFMIGRSAVTYGDLPPGRGATLTAGGIGITMLILPVGLSAVLTSGTLLDWQLATSTAVALLFVVALERYELFRGGASPGHLARETVFAEMAPAVVVVDREGRVLDANRSARRTFGIDATGAVGTPLREAVGAGSDALTDGVVPLDTTTGRRQFEVRQSQLRNRRGDPVGRSVRFRDVTDRRTHEQRLDVLNRVLRHNLRNDLDAVRAFAEALGEADADEATLAGRIRATASGLVELSATVARAERLLAREHLDCDRIDVAALARRVAGEAGGDSPAEVTVSTDGSGELRSDPEVLEAVLEELVANAIEHNDRPEPRVGIAVEETADGVVLELRDDGPGIPDRERAVLLGEEETPLHHGSGLGLWLVRWGVTRLGGDLTVDGADPRGSIVAVWLPDRTGRTRQEG